ncbi:hypothetical protein R3P38DRAFT_1314528 [Favolaschia claudopus]|uniref:F-box domain-containing protein n=1 Tax=Favolaschia claudopus TaxID=2862362 RepID=A0AAW0B068_9AGAR
MDLEVSAETPRAEAERSACFISSIPRDTLIEIMLRCLRAERFDRVEGHVDGDIGEGPVESISSYGSDERETSHDFPLYLTEICRWWREAALETPRLWTSVRMTLAGNSMKQHCAVLALAELWLSRGVKELIQFGSFNPQPLTLRHLCKLHVWFDKEMDLFLDALRLPSLSTLSLTLTVSPSWNPFRSQFWMSHADQLTEVELKLPMGGDLRQVFHTMPNTRSLHVDIRVTPSFFHSWGPELLPTLATLTIEVVYPRDGSLLRSVRTILSFLEQRWSCSAARNCSSPLERVKFDDATNYGGGSCELVGMDDVLAADMEFEFNRIRQLNAGGMKVDWQVQGEDILLPRVAMPSRVLSNEEVAINNLCELIRGPIF